MTYRVTIHGVGTWSGPGLSLAQAIREAREARNRLNNAWIHIIDENDKEVEETW